MGLYGAFIAAAQVALSQEGAEEKRWNEHEKQYLLDSAHKFFGFEFSSTSIDECLGELIYKCKRAIEIARGTMPCIISVRAGLSALRHLSIPIIFENSPKNYIISRKHFTSLFNYHYCSLDKEGGQGLFRRRLTWTWQKDMFMQHKQGNELQGRIYSQRLIEGMSKIAKAANQYLLYEEFSPKADELTTLSRPDLPSEFYGALFKAVGQIRGKTEFPDDASKLFVELVKKLLEDVEPGPAESVNCQDGLEWAYNFLQKRLAEPVAPPKPSVVREILRQLQGVRCTSHPTSMNPDDIRRLSEIHFTCLDGIHEGAAIVPVCYRFLDQGLFIAHEQIEFFMGLLSDIANTAKNLFNAQVSLVQAESLLAEVRTLRAC